MYTTFMSESDGSCHKMYAFCDKTSLRRTDMAKNTRRHFVPFLFVLALILSVAMSLGALAADADATEVTGVTFRTEPCAGAPGGRFQTVLYVDEGSALMDFQIALSFSDTLIASVEATPLVDDLTVEVTDGVAYITFTNVAENLTERTELVAFTMTLRGNIAPSEVDAQTGLSDAYPFLSFDEAYHASSAEASTMDADLTFRALTITSDFGGVSVYAYGDVNQSGHVSINDVTVLRQYLIDMRELSDAQATIANVYTEDEDSDEHADELGLSIFDAALIQKSLTSELSLGPSTDGSEDTNTENSAGSNTDTNAGGNTSTPSGGDDTGTNEPTDPTSCTHELTKQTLTVTPDGCHTYTITQNACACGTECHVLDFSAPDCHFTHDASLDADTAVDSFAGTSMTYVCDDDACALVRRESALSGTSEEMGIVSYTLTEYCILSGDGTYEVLCSFTSEYQVVNS